MLAGKLARMGIQVALLEKEKLPRYKCCAGGLTLRAAKLLDFDISGVVENKITGATITYAGYKPYQRQNNTLVGYTVMRDNFDQLLTEQAEKAGAVVLQEHEVTKILMDNERVQVFTPVNNFCSKLIVGADGSRGVVAKNINFKAEFSYVVAIESEVAVSDNVRQKWSSQITIDLGRVRGGYAWVFPKSSHLSIGIGCDRSNAKDFKENLWGIY